MNWRDLKRELFGQPPQQRPNKTLDVTDVFNSRTTPTKDRTVPITPHNQPSDVLLGNTENSQSTTPVR